FRETALDNSRRIIGRATVGARVNTVLSAGPGPNFRLEYCRYARRGGGYHPAQPQQFAIRALGNLCDPLAIARTWLSLVADAAALRPFQTAACRWRMGVARLGELGSA